jgi:hypothetical protein
MAEPSAEKAPFDPARAVATPPAQCSFGAGNHSMSWSQPVRVLDLGGAA